MTWLEKYAHSNERSIASQVWSGLKITLNLLIGFACITVYVMGLYYVVDGDLYKATAFLSPTLPILYFTAHLWVKVLPGFLLLGAIAGTRSARTIDSSEVLLITIVLGISAFLSLQLLNRKPSCVDRVAIVVAVTCALAGAVVGGRAEVAGCLAMTAALAIPWLIQKAR